MIIINLLTTHHMILPRRMSQVQVTTKMILMKNKDINMEKP